MIDHGSEELFSLSAASLLAHKRTVPLHYLDTFIYLAASSLASLQTRKEKAKKKKKNLAQKRMICMSDSDLNKTSIVKRLP